VQEGATVAINTVVAVIAETGGAAAPPPQLRLQKKRRQPRSQLYASSCRRASCSVYGRRHRESSCRRWVIHHRSTLNQVAQEGWR